MNPPVFLIIIRWGWVQYSSLSAAGCSTTPKGRGVAGSQAWRSKSQMNRPVEARHVHIWFPLCLRVSQCRIDGTR